MTKLIGIWLLLFCNFAYATNGYINLPVTGGAAIWGGITGTLSAQTDLQTALNAKQSTISFAAFGSTPNANGGSISGGVITLQPADGTHSGGLNLGNQSIVGVKTFVNPVTGSDGIQVTGGYSSLTDSSGASIVVQSGSINSNSLNANNMLANSGTSAIELNSDGSIAIFDANSNTISTNSSGIQFSMDAANIFAVNNAVQATDNGNGSFIAHSGQSSINPGGAAPQFPTYPYTSNMAFTGDDGSGNGQFNIFSQGNNYWNIVNVDSGGNVLSRFAFGNDGTFLGLVQSNAAFIVGGSGGGTGNTYLRVADSPTQGVELGDGSGEQLNVGNGQVTTSHTILDDGTGKASLSAENISGLTASTALVADSSKNVISSSTTSTELSYVHGVTSAIQTQLNAKANVSNAYTTDTSTTTPRNNLALNIATRFTGAATITINGIAAGSDGQVIYLTNLTGNSMTITDNSGSATGAKIRVPGLTGTKTLSNGDTSALIYDATTGVWRLMFYF